MLPLALGNAASVVVGQSLGAHQYGRARAAGITGIALAMCCAAVVGCSVYVFADGIAGLYSIDADVRRTAAGLLAIISVYHLFDALQAVAVNILRGYKRAMVPMVIYAMALWGVGLGGGYVIGLTHVDLGWLGLQTPLGVRGFWLAAIASLIVAGGLVTVYFLHVSAKTGSDTV